MSELTLRGTIRGLVYTKNYGFIKGNNGPEYFFHRDDFNGHWNDLVQDCDNGGIIPVIFEDNPSPKGPRAKNVRRTDYPNQT
jgi:cold shock CspA family protein